MGRRETLKRIVTLNLTGLICVIAFGLSEGIYNQPNLMDIVAVFAIGAFIGGILSLLWWPLTEENQDRLFYGLVAFILGGAIAISITGFEVQNPTNIVYLGAFALGGFIAFLLAWKATLRFLVLTTTILLGGGTLICVLFVAFTRDTSSTRAVWGIIFMVLLFGVLDFFHWLKAKIL